MTDDEARAWKHYTSTTRLNSVKNTEVVARRKSLYIDRGWILINGNKPDSLKKGLDEFKTHTAARILNQNPDKVIFNTCPVCNELARTPKARQCRHCGCDWHTESLKFGFAKNNI